MQWQQVWPYPTGRSLRAVVWGPPGFVAVSSDGEIFYSADEQQWQRERLPGKHYYSLNGVSYIRGKYVVVGNKNLIAVSTNGQNWLIANQETNGVLEVCAGGAGVFAAIGAGQDLMVSTNGIHWRHRITPADFRRIAFGNGTWVASTGGSSVYVSSNLVDWTQVATENYTVATNWVIGKPANIGFPSEPALTSICFGGNRFVLGGAQLPDSPDGVSYGTVLKTSTNGLDWDSVNGLDSAGEIRDMVFANGQFVAVCKDHFLRSTDRVSWATITAPEVPGDLAGIGASSDGRFLAVGSLGAMVRSHDGAVWQTISTGPRVEIRSVAWAKGRFVAAAGLPSYLGGPTGASAVLTSTNGSDWQAALTNLDTPLSAVAYGNGVWVVTGDDGRIFTCRNGRNWTDHSLAPTSHDLHQVVYGRGRFVAFADFLDLVYRSADGKHWVASEAPLASEISKARFLNHRFIGVGGNEDGLIFSSRNGVKWKKTTLVGAGWLAGAAYGKGRYVAVGRNSSAVSFDGVNWNAYPTSTVLYDLHYVDGWFVGVGPGGLMLSHDGVEWRVADDPISPAGLSLLAWGEGTLVGAEGFSLYRGGLQDSDVFRRTLRRLYPSQLEFYGRKGHRYRLEQSCDLLNWRPTSRWSRGHNDYLVWEMKTSFGSRGFWRVVSRP